MDDAEKREVLDKYNVKFLPEGKVQFSVESTFTNHDFDISFISEVNLGGIAFPLKGRLRLITETLGKSMFPNALEVDGKWRFADKSLLHNLLPTDEFNRLIEAIGPMG